MISNKILILTSEFPPQPGGIGTHAYNLAKGLEEKGFSVKVICDTRSLRGEEERVFDASLNFEVNRIFRKKIIVLSYFKRIQAAFAYARQAEVIICTGKFSLWLGGLLSFFLSRRYVSIVHGSELLLSNFILRKLTNLSLKQFDLVIAVSNYTKSLVDYLELNNIVVINNGINLPSTNLKVSKIPSKPVLLTIGNVTLRKGQHNVIKALPALLISFPEIEYHIVGIPTEKDEFQKLAEQLNVQKAVKFYGAVSEKEKIKMLKETDIFIMLSEATKEGDVEGFGIAILEANALGIPAIGAQGCGIEDAVKENYSGVLVYARDDKQILQAVNEILRDYTTYSENARYWARGFSWDLVTSQYIMKIFER